MKKILATTIGLTAFVAFAFQTPNNNPKNQVLPDEVPLVITLDGINDNLEIGSSSNDFAVETE